MRVNRIPIAVGGVLRQARKLAGVSQETLALESGVDRTFVSQIERGVRQPTLTTLFRLCGALGVRPSELIASVEKRVAQKR